jgi:hypothetical protein
VFKIEEVRQRWKWQFVDRLNVEDEEEKVENKFTFMSLEDGEDR